MKKGFVFYGLVDFFENKENIKTTYEEMEISDKEIYKMYVYALPWMDDNIKDLIWEYINGYEESIFDLSKEYRKAKTKLEKRKAIEMYYTD